MAVDNGDGTWTFTLDPPPTVDVEYLFVVDDVQEDMVNAAPHPDVDGDGDSDWWDCTPITNYFDYANRLWQPGTDTVEGLVYGTCGSTCNSVVLTPDASDVNATWSDEFDQADGTAVNAAKWFCETEAPNNGLWFNNEKQEYTDSLNNSYIRDGMLHIVARSESTADGRTFTSARLNTRRIFGPGSIEVKAMMPFSSYGTWPAIWMLGTTSTNTSVMPLQIKWPFTGEADIMESHKGATDYFTSAIHYNTHPTTYAPAFLGGVSEKVDAAFGVHDISQNFHIYGMQWDDENVHFRVDGQTHLTYTRGDVEGVGGVWPFEKRNLFLILNVAVGGTLSQPPNPLHETFPPATMLVDWVRYYAA